VQFGAKIELYAGVDIFNVYGFIGLDALIQFDPFRLSCHRDVERCNRVGVLQLPVLYRHIRWSLLWIAASAGGWLTLGLAIGKSIDRTPDILALGAIPAAFTGLALAWLWIDPAPVSKGSAD